MVVFMFIKEQSQRVPNKNFRIFNGMPLWEWMCFNFRDFKIYIDTDSDKILQKCESIKNPDLIAYKRKKELCGHKTSVNLLIENFLSQQKEIKDNEFIVQIHVTSPFLKPSSVINAYTEMCNKSHDSAVSCDVFQNRFWILNSFWNAYYPINHDPKKLVETQSLTKYYMENSAFYIFTRQSFLQANNRVGKNPYFYTGLEFPENLDIDTERDWDMCKKIEKLSIN